MPGSSPPALALALASAVVTAGLWAGAGPALGAVTAPTDCTASRAALAAARQKADPTAIAELERQVARECSGTGTTPTSTAAPTSKPGQPSGSKPPSGEPGSPGQGGDDPGSTTPEDSGSGHELPGEVDPDTEVDPVADDGSRATTSGSQVKDVPEGSVDTGSVQ